MWKEIIKMINKEENYQVLIQWLFFCLGFFVCVVFFKVPLLLYLVIYPFLYYGLSLWVISFCGVRHPTSNDVNTCRRLYSWKQARAFGYYPPLPRDSLTLAACHNTLPNIFYSHFLSLTLWMQISLKFKLKTNGCMMRENCNGGQNITQPQSTHTKWIRSE